MGNYFQTSMICDARNNLIISHEDTYKLFFWCITIDETFKFEFQQQSLAILKMKLLLLPAPALFLDFRLCYSMYS